MGGWTKCRNEQGKDKNLKKLNVTLSRVPSNSVSSLTVMKRDTQIFLEVSALPVQVQTTVRVSLQLFLFITHYIGFHLLSSVGGGGRVVNKCV